MIIICEKLNDLGCTPAKSLKTKFPEWLTNKELIRHFIRGYYDGDGGIYMKGKAAQARIIGTNHFIQQIISTVFFNYIYLATLKLFLRI